MKTQLDWSDYKDAGMGDAYADIPKHGGDFAKAVAVCINSRQCETESKLVMCPSFKITGNPHLSTGGRVRLLKAALSADSAEQALQNPELQEAMDLCVACKGCKRECENNVDMPLIKAEYLAQRLQQQGLKRGLSWRARLLAHTPQWLHAYPWLRTLIRWRNNNRLLARLTERLFSLSAQVPLAEPAAQAYRLPKAVGDAVNIDPNKPEVVLFIDTFSHYFEPKIASAAELVLNRAGYRVHIAQPAPTDTEPNRPLCCGRTYLAQGMVDKARDEVQRLCEALQPHIAAGRTLVGLEASCVLGLRDDAKALGLGEMVDKIAANSFLFEEFLSKEIRAKRLNLKLNLPEGIHALVHGHCHQKAVGAMKAMRRVLKNLLGDNFSIIDSGCCGMAGSFGIEAEHAEMAAAMAEQDLMPALRAQPDARVVANGFSCRQQMRAKQDSRPQHLAILLAEGLESTVPAA